MTEFEIIRRNKSRGLILKILSTQHPHGLDVLTIRSELATLGHPVDERSFASYVAYLESAGCVDVKKIARYDIRIVSITNRGLNILDAIAPDTDPGIDVEGL